MFFFDFLFETDLNKATAISFSEDDVHCLVFRTSLQNKNDVSEIADVLNNCPEILKWSVDLENWEKILRIECKDITSESIIDLIESRGVSISELTI